MMHVFIVGCSPAQGLQPVQVPVSVPAVLSFGYWYQTVVPVLFDDVIYIGLSHFFASWP